MAAVTNVFVFKKMIDGEIYFSPEKFLPFLANSLVSTVFLIVVIFSRIDSHSLVFYMLCGLSTLTAYSALMCLKDARNIIISFRERKVLLFENRREIEAHELRGILKQLLVTDSDGVSTGQQRVLLDVGSFSFEFLNSNIVLEGGAKADLIGLIVEKSNGLVMAQEIEKTAKRL